MLEVEVVKNYGNKDLEHIKDGKIRIEYPDTHKRYICSVDFKAGDECILPYGFNGTCVPICAKLLRIRAVQVFATAVRYRKTENGFNALGLMALSKEKHTLISNTGVRRRGAVYYSLGSGSSNIGQYR